MGSNLNRLREKKLINAYLFNPLHGWIKDIASETPEVADTHTGNKLNSEALYWLYLLPI